MNPVLSAAHVVGGQTILAKALSVTPQAVSQWTRGSPVPVSRVIEIARVSGWRVTPHAIRPDVYPHPDDGLPDDFRGQAGREHAA
jgi:DNA-binding transcriptional regulator YdaS (Cro superfamily)